MVLYPVPSSASESLRITYPRRPNKLIAVAAAGVSTSKTATTIILSATAASLGFTGPSIKTLETGCEVDFHFVDRTTAAIALDDYIYTLKKQ